MISNHATTEMPPLSYCKISLPKETLTYFRLLCNENKKLMLAKTQTFV
jgi:hypothetical protein